MTRQKVSDWFRFFAPRLTVTAVIIGMITRTLMILDPVTVADFTSWEWARIFILGAINDVAFAMIALLPAFLIYTTLGSRQYDNRKARTIVGGLLVLLVVLCFLPGGVWKRVDAVILKLARILSVLMLSFYLIQLLVPGIRKGWKWFTMWVTMFIYSALMVLNAAAEFCYWDEYGVRYNFIAVDYLNLESLEEVLTNLVEIYPLGLILFAVAAVASLVCWLMTRDGDLKDAGIGSFRAWRKNLAIILPGAVFAALFLHIGYRNFGGRNAFATELQENGCWNFFEAAASTDLDYVRYFPTMEEDKALALRHTLCGQGEDGVRKVAPSGEPHKKNVVLIEMESMGADFMGRYGNPNGLTPVLDSLAKESLTFDNLFATGNRTVRGIESVTLCNPPTPGESIVKRSDCGDRYTVGDVFRQWGYSTRFLYGGDSGFDNMKAFFSENGYDIVDINDFKEGEVTFTHSWGACDEDTFGVALRLLDEDAKSGKPSFTHIMTISNHSPFTFPEGKIDFEGKMGTRNPAVRYADYAMGKFLDEARTREWFSNTVFVFVADHCATSAGKTRLPLDCYHIAGMIYAPGFIEPRAVEEIASQIDVMPTTLALLGLGYDAHFYGQDALDSLYRGRAFLATFQDLGYYSGDILTVLAPVRKATQFTVTRSEDGGFVENEVSASLLQKMDRISLRREQRRRRGLDSDSLSSIVGKRIRQFTEWVESRKVSSPEEDREALGKSLIEAEALYQTAETGMKK